MEKKKIVIIGSSVAGSTLALLLAKEGINVVVYEQKKQHEIGKKLCANVVTKTFFNYSRALGMEPAPLVKNRFDKAIFVCKNKRFEFPVQDYEIDRQKFLNQIIKKAKQQGAKFFFETKFLNFFRENKKHGLILEKNKKKKIEKADIVIGADGALSEVAKKADLWQDRQFDLCYQVSLKKKLMIERRKVKKNEYYCFLDKKYGYYSYVFPSKDNVTIGNAEELNNKNRSFQNLLSMLKIKGIKKKAALIPAPKVIRTQKDNIFLIGDAACCIKFNGGGIIPAMKNAFSLRDVILNRNYNKIKRFQREIYINSVLARFVKNLNDNDFLRFLEIVDKNPEIKGLVKQRDEMSRRKLKCVFKKPKLIYFIKNLA
jgi:flavin-dependent dehydrogenase